MRWVAAGVLCATCAGLAWPADDPPYVSAIQDNSFLIEEAYNQEDGVVQHIGLYVRDTKSNGWIASFTEEWPAPSIKHQLSFSIPVASDDGSAIGSLFFNYRYQWLGNGDA